MASINLDFYLRSITPVHVGGAQDKHWVEGMDYLVENGQVYLFNQKKLMAAIGDVNQYCNALESGKYGMERLLKVRKIDLATVSELPKFLVGSASEIKACIKNGMNGKAYIPGSSIKGAIRSIIFSSVFEGLDNNAKREIKNDRNPDAKLLGNFKDSLMRFIQVSDVYFDVATILCNAKIFNLQNKKNEWAGGWKHSGNTNEKFQPEGFTFAYECIPANSVGQFRISFDEKLFEMAKKHRNINLPFQVKNIFSEGFQKKLSVLIQQHTERYLKKELDFFLKEEYKLSETPQVETAFNAIQKENSNKLPVFRMASGSGFHSITGDWIYAKSHIVNEVWGDPFEDDRDKNRNPNFDKDYRTFGISFNKRKHLQGKMKWKSRRLTFDYADEHFQFSPMGFVQLVNQEFYKKELKPAIEAKQKAEEVATEKARLALLQKEEADKKAAEEARKPKIRTFAEVKKEGLLDGEVIGQSGIQVIVKPFVEGFENQKLQVRYAAGFPNGTIVTVKALIQGKNIQLQAPIKEKGI